MRTAFALALLQALLASASEGDEGGEGPRNLPVIRIMFRNDTQEETPSAIGVDAAGTNHSRGGGVPLAYCLDTEFPSDAFCDARELLRSGVFAEKMLIQHLSMDVPFPARENTTCAFEFRTVDEGKASPLLHKNTECGYARDHPSIPVTLEKEGLDDVVQRFRVGNVTDMIIISYTPGFGCRYRFKPLDLAESEAVAFKLDSFYCMINFGSYDPETIPKTDYPHGIFYKHNGEEWKGVGIWPDYY